MRKREYILIMFAVFGACVAGCAAKKPVTSDPCANASQMCWGRAGKQPADVAACAGLAACYDWEMVARK